MSLDPQSQPRSDLHLYRPNVGIVVFNAQGQVWLGRRANARASAHNWQFPQGGVDAGEELEAAARRELTEETGIASVDLLARTQDWVAYDFPPEARGAKWARGYKGQKQIWFAFRFTAEDAEVNLTAHHPPEFDAWRWAELSEVADLVVPFKREAYRQMLAVFAPLAHPVQPA